MTDDDTSAFDLFALLADDRAFAILNATATEPLSAKQLAAHCGASTPTVYRRIDAMQEYDLLESDTRLDEDGNHYTVYRCNVDRVDVGIDPGDGDVRIDLTYSDSVDRFRDLWEGFRE